jgi:hypothetical protein
MFLLKKKDAMIDKFMKEATVITAISLAASLLLTLI